MQCSWPGVRDVLSRQSASAWPSCPKTVAAAHVATRRKARRAGYSQFATVRRRGATSGVRHAARGADLLLLHPNDVPHPGRNGPVRERRNQLRRPVYAAPELLATGPNQVWSWDITKLRGPAKWTYYYLYVILDIYSRYVVGWVVATEESAAIAKHLIATCVDQEGVNPFELTLHADRGPSMTSKPVALLLSDLGVVRSHSRPYVSDDNPFSEAQFKTLKYRPGFPDRFGTVQQARAHCIDFFAWYNREHRHSGIGLLTPHDVHHGLAAQRTTERAAVLRTAFAHHPERFPHGIPVPPVPPSAVWINPPQSGVVSPSLP